MTDAFESLRQLQNFVDCLSNASRCRDVNMPIKEHPSTNRVRICWDRRGKGSLIDQDASVASYFDVLKNRDYTVLLADRGMLQISMEFEREEMVKHRYCYFPCPLVVPEEDEWFVDDEGLEGYMNSLTPKKLYEQMRLGGAMRIDFDQAAANVTHAACHLTLFGNAPTCQDSRIPMFGPLSLGHFVTFFFGHYYRTWWESSDELRSMRPEWRNRTIVEEQLFELHVEWRSRL